MKKFLILLILFNSCQVKVNEDDKVNLIEEEKNLFKGITIITQENLPLSILERKLTFEEKLSGLSVLDTLQKNDTISISFNDPIELISITPADLFARKDYILESGDTLFLIWENDELYFSKSDVIEFMLPEWSYDLILPNNFEFKKIDSLKSIFAKTQKIGSGEFLFPNIKNQDIWEENLPKYVYYTNSFYNKVIDSLNKKSDSKNQLYAILTEKKKFNDLDQIFNIVKDDELNKNLYNEFLTVENFKNRHLSSVFGQYFFRNYARQKNLNLQNVYNDSFQEFDPIIIRYFKSRTIQEMVGKKHNRDIILANLDKYKKEFGELSPLEELAQDMEYQAIEIDDMILQGMNGENILWELLKKKWKGKVIYLDFWASWCAPCLRAMPYSHTLKEKFNEKEVIFVYLAINDKEQPWLEKSNSFGISNNNYLIKNSKTSEFIKANKIHTIPRYLIFDRDGNLVHLDAPGPEKDESFEILMQILKK